MALVYGLVAQDAIVLSECSLEDVGGDGADEGFPEAPKVARYILQEKVVKELGPQKRSFGHKKHHFHYRVTDNRLCFMVVVQKSAEDEKTSVKIPYNCIEDILAEFMGSVYDEDHAMTIGYRELELNDRFARVIKSKLEFWNRPDADISKRTKAKEEYVTVTICNKYNCTYLANTSVPAPHHDTTYDADELRWRPDHAVCPTRIFACPVEVEITIRLDPTAGVPCRFAAGSLFEPGDDGSMTEVPCRREVDVKSDVLAVSVVTVLRDVEMSRGSLYWGVVFSEPEDRMRGAVLGVDVGFRMRVREVNPRMPEFGTLPLFAKLKYQNRIVTYFGILEVGGQKMAVVADVGDTLPPEDAYLEQLPSGEWRVVLNNNRSPNPDDNEVGYAVELVGTAGLASGVLEHVDTPVPEGEPSSHRSVQQDGLLRRMHRVLRNVTVRGAPVYDLVVYLLCCSGVLRDVSVVGGAVRDALFTDTPIADVDLVVACPYADLAHHLQDYLGKLGEPGLALVDSGRLASYGCMKMKASGGTDKEELDLAVYKGVRVFHHSPAPPGQHVRHYTEAFSYAFDSKSRDFTVNAVYFSMDGNFYDPTGDGFDDAQNKKARYANPAELCFDVGGCFRLWKMVLKDYAVHRTTISLALHRLLRDIRRFREQSVTPAHGDPALWTSLDEHLRRFVIPASPPPPVGEEATLEQWLDKLVGKLFRPGKAFVVTVSELYRACDAAGGVVKEQNRLFWRCVQGLCRIKDKGNEPFTVGRVIQVVRAFSRWDHRLRPVVKKEPDEIPKRLVRVSRELLGEGSFGQVLEGEYRRKKVAVKMLHVRATEVEEADFLAEARLHCSVRHPHVVKFIAICPPPEMWLVMECVPPTLWEARRAIRGSLPAGQMFLAAQQVAEGMAAIHSLNIIHRDLRAINVMVGPPGRDRRCRVADFGLATVKKATSAARLAGTLPPFEESRGNVHWKAPEVAQQGNWVESEKSDVFSFGVLLFEIASRGEVPFEGAQDQYVTGNYLSNLHQQRISASWPQSYRDLMLRCLATNPEERPTFVEIVETISNLGKLVDFQLELSESE